MIYAFSFLFGDDFNYFVATNISIDLYKVKGLKQKAKLVKSISLSGIDPLQFYLEPMGNVIVICDTKG